MRASVELAARIGTVAGTQLSPAPAARVHGGSINECYRWESRLGPLFVKVADASQHAMLAAEAAGLEALRAAQAVRVPHVLGCAVDAGQAWLALEWLELGSADARAEEQLGARLALQHGQVADSFGWSQDNTIGRTPQINTWCQDWVSFWRERRLRYQLDLAARNGHGARLKRRGRCCWRVWGASSATISRWRPCCTVTYGVATGVRMLTARR